MSDYLHPENMSNLISEQINSSKDELIRVSALSRKEVEVMVERAVRCSMEKIIEPLLRKVVKEVIGSPVENFLVTMNSFSFRNGENHAFESRNLRLKFMNELSSPIFTGKEIKGQEQTNLQVALVNSISGEVIKSCPEASSKVEIVVLDGDFKDDWTPEEFQEKVVRKKEGKKLLTGKKNVILVEGIGSITGIKFKNEAKWMKKCELRLGARVVSKFNGSRIVEAVSNPFLLKDCRNNNIRKHKTSPCLTDEVFRLVHIQKDGPCHKRLINENVETVQHFLILLSVNPERLQKILEPDTHKWEAILHHAQTSTIDEKLRFYFPNSNQNNGVVFNSSGHVQGVVLDCRFCHIDNLPDFEKAEALKALESSLNHWNKVMVFDNEPSLLNHCCYVDPINEDDSEFSLSSFMELLQGEDIPYHTIHNPEAMVEEYLNNDPNTAFNLRLFCGKSKAQIRWVKISSILKWSAIRRRILGCEGRNHARKRCRIC